MLRRLRACDESITNAMDVDRLRELMPWSLLHIVHHVDALPEDSVTVPHVRKLFETGYKVAIANGAMGNPRGSGNDERHNWALDTRVQVSSGRKPKKNDNSKSSYKQHKKEQSQYAHGLANTEEYLFSTAEYLEDLSLSDQIIVDSVASSHMCGNASQLSDIMPCKRTVMVANGNTVEATRKGTLSLQTSHKATLKLHEVLLVEGMPSVLLSVPALMRRNNDCKVSFDHGRCMITCNGKTIAEAKMEISDAYTCWKPTEKGSQLVDQGAKQRRLSPDISGLWHQRIGHLPINAINHCGSLGLGVPSNLKPIATLCECCIKANISKTPTPKTHSRYFKPGKCWVSDSKGPVRTESVGGRRYYTIQVDAATRYKVVHFVKSTDSITQEQNFINLVKWSRTQTENKVKLFRSDGGPEYSSDHFCDALKLLGIHHERSTPDNQWQKGIAERAHRTIIEMTLAILFHSIVARRWWVEAMNTAIFILNRVVHTNQTKTTTIEAFTGHKPTLANLKVFGCVAYNMINDPTRRDKLEPKATKCIVLGYAKNMKAYKLYDLEQRKVITGVHVRFYESEFLGERLISKTTR
ncbi:hypothetical protein LEN26_000646 [Aphanomyces euteiches]|nr:hypothetical protein LEN26_000646 [Aphanomyces euteiches]